MSRIVALKQDGKMNSAVLHAFIVRAKKSTYVGDGAKALSSRPGSHDLAFTEGDWRYLDSYFGGTDFLGQEVVWFNGTAMWAMNYHGYILRADLIDATKAGETLKAALRDGESQSRLLDNFEYVGAHGLFTIKSTGTIQRFSGRENITVDGILAYALDYQGGLIKP